MKRAFLFAIPLLFLVLTPGQHAQQPAEGITADDPPRKKTGKLPLDFFAKDEKSFEVELPHQ